MSIPNKKKVVKVSHGPKKAQRGASTSSNFSSEHPLIFGKKNYMFIGIGFGLIILGLLLMQGGGMPNPDVWDDNLIYSFRRITLAPIVMLSGLVVGIYAIFK